MKTEPTIEGLAAVLKQNKAAGSGRVTIEDFGYYQFEGSWNCSFSVGKERIESYMLLWITKDQNGNEYFPYYVIAHELDALFKRAKPEEWAARKTQ